MARVPTAPATSPRATAPSGVLAHRRTPPPAETKRIARPPDRDDGVAHGNAAQRTTWRQTAVEQVYAQKDKLSYQQKETTARVASMMESADRAQRQQVLETMRHPLTEPGAGEQEVPNRQRREDPCKGRPGGALV